MSSGRGGGHGVRTRPRARGVVIVGDAVCRQVACARRTELSARTEQRDGASGGRHAIAVDRALWRIRVGPDGRERRRPRRVHRSADGPRRAQRRRRAGGARRRRCARARSRLRRMVALAASSGIPVAATLRLGEPCPEGITALWRDDLATRVTLPPLDLEQVGEMLALALGAPVDSYTRHRSGTSPPATCSSCASSCAPASAAARWLNTITCGSGRVASREPRTSRTCCRDTVMAQPPAVQRVVELLAVGEPLGATIVEDLSDNGALDAAEAAGLVVAQRRSRRLEVRLVHPIYAQVVREALGRVRIETLSRELADAMSKRGQRRADDVLRIASLQLTAGAAADPVVLLAAARHARQYADAELAEGLARQAFEVGGGAAAAITLAESLYWQGRHDEVLDLLAGGILDDAAPKHVMYGTIHIASALFFGQGRLADARMDPTWHRASGPGLRGRPGRVAGADAHGRRARRRVHRGGPQRARSSRRSPLARLDATIAMLPALGACGGCRRWPTRAPSRSSWRRPRGVACRRPSARSPSGCSSRTCSTDRCASSVRCSRR